MPSQLKYCKAAVKHASYSVNLFLVVMILRAISSNKFCWINPSLIGVILTKVALATRANYSTDYRIARLNENGIDLLNNGMITFKRKGVTINERKS